MYTTYILRNIRWKLQQCTHFEMGLCVLCFVLDMSALRVGRRDLDFKLKPDEHRERVHPLALGVCAEQPERTASWFAEWVDLSASCSIHIYIYMVEYAEKPYCHQHHFWDLGYNESILVYSVGVLHGQWDQRQPLLSPLHQPNRPPPTPASHRKRQTYYHETHETERGSSVDRLYFLQYFVSI